MFVYVVIVSFSVIVNARAIVIVSVTFILSVMPPFSVCIIVSVSGSVIVNAIIFISGSFTPTVIAVAFATVIFSILCRPLLDWTAMELLESRQRSRQLGYSWQRSNAYSRCSIWNCPRTTNLV